MESLAPESPKKHAKKPEISTPAIIQISKVSEALFLYENLFCILILGVLVSPCTHAGILASDTKKGGRFFTLKSTTKSTAKSTANLATKPVTKPAANPATKPTTKPTAKPTAKPAASSFKSAIKPPTKSTVKLALRLVPKPPK